MPSMQKHECVHAFEICLCAFLWECGHQPPRASFQEDCCVTCPGFTSTRSLCVHTRRGTHARMRRRERSVTEVQTSSRLLRQSRFWSGGCWKAGLCPACARGAHASAQRAFEGSSSASSSCGTRRCCGQTLPLEERAAAPGARKCWPTERK